MKLKKGQKQVILATVLIILIYLFGSGFLKCRTLFIQDFKLNENGMVLTVGNSSSAGSVRKLKIYQNEGGKLYLDPLTAFGGVNGSWGAKTSFEIPLQEDTELIGLYRTDNCYEPVLVKNDQGIWERAK